ADCPEHAINGETFDGYLRPFPEVAVVVQHPLGAVVAGTHFIDTNRLDTRQPVTGVQLELGTDSIESPFELVHLVQDSLYALGRGLVLSKVYFPPDAMHTSWSLRD